MSRRVMRGFSPVRLRSAREAAGLSQADLARLADIGRTTLYQWESGTASPQVDMLARVVAVLSVPMTDVVAVHDGELFPGDLRVRRGLTQPQLGKAAGLSTALIGAIERGEVQLSGANAAAIAGVLELPVDSLIAAHARARRRPPGSPA